MARKTKLTVDLASLAKGTSVDMSALTAKQAASMKPEQVKASIKALQQQQKARLKELERAERDFARVVDKLEQTSIAQTIKNEKEHRKSIAERHTLAVRSERDLTAQIKKEEAERAASAKQALQKRQAADKEARARQRAEDAANRVFEAQDRKALRAAAASSESALRADERILAGQFQDANRRIRDEARLDNRDDRARRRAAHSRRLQREREERGAEKEAEKLTARAVQQAAANDAKLARLQGRNVGPLARAQRIADAYPGFARIARATGLGNTAGGRGLLQGLMSAGTFAGGVASGSAGVGGAAGGVAGGQAAASFGLGAASSAVLGAATMGAGAILAAYVGYLKGGVDRATQNVVRALAVDKALQVRVAPSVITSAFGVRQTMDRQLALAARSLGIDPEEGRAIQAQINRAGGWAGGARADAAMSALQLHAAGLSPGADVIDRIAYGMGRGGGLKPMPLYGLPNRLIRAGFQDQEIPDFYAALDRARGTAAGVGAHYSAAGALGAVSALSPAVGAVQAQRMTFGLQGAMQALGTGGVGALGNPSLGLFALRTLGGFKPGGSFADLMSAQQRLTEGPTAQGLESVRNLINRSGMSSAAKQAFTMARMQELGVPMTPDLAQSWLRGQAASSDVLRGVTDPQQAAADAAAFGLTRQAQGVNALSARRAAQIAGVDLAAGQAALPGAQRLDQQLALAADALGSFASAIDTAKARLAEIANGPTNWVTTR